MKKGTMILAIAALVLIGCGHEGKYVPGNTHHNTGDPVETSLAALVALEGCDELLDSLKAQAIADMTELLDQNLELVLDGIENGDFYGNCYWEEDIAYGGRGMPTSANQSSSPAPSGAKDFSTTNNQVSGVDEADFLKNDGKYIYIVADGKFQIIDAWPAANAEKIASVDMEGTPKKLFVHKDRAVVYSSLGSINQNTGYDPYDYYGGSQECTYGYNCDFTGDGKILQATVFNIEDKENPEKVREITFSGSYLNSRRIEDIVYSVVVFPEVTIPGINYWPQELAEMYNYCYVDEQPFNSADEAIAAFEQLKEDNIEIIEDSSITEYLPGITDVRYINGQVVTEEGLLDSCDNFYMAQVDDAKALLSMVAFEIDELSAMGATTVVGQPGAVYATAESLYVANRQRSGGSYGWYYEDAEANPEATTVHKFRLYPNHVKTDYVGSGVVKGRILNQFSMDEYEGHLRVASTTGHLPDPNTHSTISILAEGNGELVTTGIIDDIAPTEDIRSARFNGRLGFVVTFKKTDPLFVFDLSDPAAPIIRGELKIPGFSTYMHMMDDKHLLTIGYDADDQGDFAWFQGIMLQIFDISNPDDPTLTHKEIIGTRGSTSDAATNHLAFNYFPVQNRLAIPMVVCEGEDGGGSYGDIMTFSGLMVYEVTATGGFDYLGGIPHEEPESEENYWGACGNWWTNSNSKVKRSIFMDDFVYSVAMDLINISHISTLDSPLTSVVLDD